MFKTDSDQRKEWERDTDIKYEIKKGALAGFSFVLRNATARGSSHIAANETRAIINIDSKFKHLSIPPKWLLHFHYKY
ncbi:OprD family porin [Sansalvadorimonas sp. 2012CJ34-2]|uniref:OprD family porin n=1 Tax=Parendozoicomonas callyspongiae TaxID=2942213 RepID=A0ABT0PFS9_9GAMM|nr:OprD family outer membrane porin [Sansalvadorimonas sp. 2012CJ34-2]MCL6270227.1 OprD family porin [Sansalvadorimonas sp. 2012CJ34-2]